jgi:hypothetical protein
MDLFAESPNPVFRHISAAIVNLLPNRRRPERLMRSKARPRLQLRTIILAACAALWTWLVVTRSVAAYLADAAPQSALWLSPGQPEALLNLADRALNAARSESVSSGDVDGSEKTDPQASVPNQSPEQSSGPGNLAAAAKTVGDSRDFSNAFAVVDQNPSVDLPTLRAAVISALLEEPLNARALRILGQLAETAKDDASAVRYMEAAARLSLHEAFAVYWLMHRSAVEGDYKTALYYADALMRTEPNFATYAVPVVAHFANEKASSSAVNALLASNPPWRSLFFRLLPQSVTDARTPLDLLLALKNSPTPPTYDDMSVYMSLLVQHKLYDLAYYTWLQFLPLDQLRSAGFLFNGNFDVTPSGMPFDWMIKQGAGVAIDIVPRSDKTGGRALEVDFLYGRVDYHSVSELVLLAPGTYQFNGQYSGEIIGPRGLKWRVVCASDSHTRIGESPMIIGTASAWKETGFTFTVPPTDCPAQYVELDLDARMASEQLVSGSLLFDELKIARVARPPNSPEAAPSTVPPQVNGG